MNKKIKGIIKIGDDEFISKELDSDLDDFENLDIFDFLGVDDDEKPE